jgi:hypothetical protein
MIDSATNTTTSMPSAVVSHRRVRTPKCRASRPPMTVPVRKLTNATIAAVRSTPARGTNQNPRKMMFPVMFATKT